jgi:hypothetical protein
MTLLAFLFKMKLCVFIWTAELSEFRADDCVPVGSINFAFLRLVVTRNEDLLAEKELFDDVCLLSCSR